MASVYCITKKLAEKNLPKDTIEEIVGSGDLVEITEKMERMLAPTLVCELLDSCACGTSKKEINSIKTVGGDTLEERLEAISALGDFHSTWEIKPTTRGSISVRWLLENDQRYFCACSASVNRKTKVSDLIAEKRSMPLSYCLCCGGHCRQHLQKLLGCRLETKSVVSSPLNSLGSKPCEFEFALVEGSYRFRLT